MFRRTTSDSAPAQETADQTPPRSGGKGRPTPTRKEAEAAARARAKPPRDKKALRRRERELRSERSRDLRKAMKEGDESALPARDRGPVRRFVRDLVDSRFGFTELLAPALILIMAVSYGGGPSGQAIGNTLWMTTLLLVIIDVLLLRFKVRREVRRRFPDTSLKGLTFYAVMRAVNMRFLRIPKPRVKIGEKLPEHYR